MAPRQERAATFRVPQWVWIVLVTVAIGGATLVAVMRKPPQTQASVRASQRIQVCFLTAHFVAVHLILTHLSVVPG